MNQQKYRKCIVKSQYKSSLKLGVVRFLKPNQLNQKIFMLRRLKIKYFYFALLIKPIHIQAVSKSGIFLRL